MMTQEEYQKSVAESQKAAHEETMWGKPARDIITCISNNTNVRPVRAIWELVQNARDVVKQGRRAKVLFKREQDALVFQHGGTPFTHKTIEALILQTSSKATDNNTEVGQYGTGFLTTHKFGLKFKLKAPLLTSEEAGRYCIIPDFEIDRSTTSKEVMRQLIEDQWEETKKWGIRFEDTTDIPFEYTIFRYIHEVERERQNAAEAFNEAPAMTPYVLLLNPQVERIAYIDDTDQQNSVFFEAPFETGQIVDDLPDGIILKNTVTINRAGKGLEKKSIYYIESKEKIDKEPFVPKATVILPIEEDTNGDLRVIRFGKNIPQIYIYLPLLGTEQWGFNFLFHSSLFTCDRDSRDSLRLVGNGQNNDQQASCNKDIVSLVNKLIWQFVEKKHSQLKDAKFLMQVNFKIQQTNDELSDYYKGLQVFWRERFETLNVVNTENLGLCEVEKVKVLDERLYRECEENHILLDAIHELLNRTKHWCVPAKGDMVYWSRTLDQWYPAGDNPHQLKIEDLVKDVQDLTVREDDLDWLHTMCQYIIDIKRDDLFNQVKLIPNDRLILQHRNQLTRPVEIDDVVRQCLDVMVPEEVERFVHPRFTDIANDNKFDYPQIKECITTYLNNHNSEQNGTRAEIMWLKKNDMERPNAPRQFDRKNYDGKLYDRKVVQCMLNMLKSLIPEDSSGFGSKVIGSFEQYYGLTASAFDGRLDKKYGLEDRAFYNAMIYDTLFGFTLLEDKSVKKEWVKEMVRKVYENSDSRSFLSNYQVYPDQNGVFKYAEWLKRQLEDTPDRALEIYDEIKLVDMGRSVKDELLCKDYNLFFQGEGQFDTIRHCQEIESELSKLHYDLSGYKHLGLITEIIKHFATTGEECERWKRLFPDIDSNKGQLMFSTLKDQTKKDSLFSLIEIEDAGRLELLAKMANEPKLVQIYQLGKNALAIKEREDNDKAFKHKLGKHVEEILKRELNEQLQGTTLKIEPVVDQQNGQDMVVYVNGEIVYYIEVKSRWSSDKSVLMSTQQHRTSYLQKHRYALCAVDMVDMSKEDAVMHRYPEFEEVEGRIKVLTRIGELNERLKDATENEDGKVHVYGGYQVLVSQKVIEKNHIEFSTFVEMLKEVVMKKISQEA